MELYVLLDRQMLTHFTVDSPLQLRAARLAFLVPTLNADISQWGQRLYVPSLFISYENNNAVRAAKATTANR